MKKYDYDLAKKIVSTLADLGVLESASMGMHEDWFWTGQTIWEDGEWKVEFLSNEDAEKMHEEFISARENGLRFFLDEKDEYGLSKINPEFTKYEVCLFGGIMGSDWATPVIEVELSDGTQKTFNCFIGSHDAETFLSNYAMGFEATAGCLSKEMRSSREGINIEDFKACHYPQE